MRPIRSLQTTPTASLLMLMAWTVGGLSAAESVPLVPPIPGPVTAAEAPAKNAPAWLGVGLDKPDEALIHHLDLQDDLGVLVTQVAPGSPAAQAEIARFDLITAVEGRPAYTVRMVQQAVQAKKPGETIRIELRTGERTRTVTVTLAPRPPGLNAPPEGHGWGHPSMPGMPGMPGGPGRPRGGQIQRPDGSVLEWNQEDEPAP